MSAPAGERLPEISKLVLEYTLFVNDVTLIISHTFYCAESFFGMSPILIVSNACRLKEIYPNALQNLQRRNSSPHIGSNIPAHFFFSCRFGYHQWLGLMLHEKNLLYFIKGAQKDATSSTSSRKWRVTGGGGGWCNKFDYCSKGDVWGFFLKQSSEVC